MNRLVHSGAMNACRRRRAGVSERHALLAKQAQLLLRGAVGVGEEHKLVAGVQRVGHPAGHHGHIVRRQRKPLATLRAE